MKKGPKIESLGEFFGWLRSNCSGKPSDIRPKVVLNEVFLADVFRLVAGSPFCTAKFVADKLRVNLESAYLGLKKLRDEGLVKDFQGKYIVLQGEA